MTCLKLHLLCLRQTVDRNARFSYHVRSEEMECKEFFCVHSFSDSPRMLLYGGYRKVSMHDGLVEDLRHQYNRFADITVCITLWRIGRSWNNVCGRLSDGAFNVARLCRLCFMNLNCRCTISDKFNY